MDDESILERELSRVLGVTVSTHRVKDNRIQVRVSGLERPHGLSVTLRPMLSWVDASLEFDNLAKTLRDRIDSSLDKGDEQFRILLDGFASLGAKYFGISNENSDAESSKINIDRFSSRVMYNEASSDDVHRLAASSILVPILALASVPEHSDNEPAAPFSTEVYDEEGAEKLAWSRRYERSRTNRSMAISLHGTSCIVCGFSFRAFYAGLAGDYVEIHHLDPVSTMGGPRVVDPRTELVPLCANCHRAAHRRWPPFSPEELRTAVTGEIRHQ